MTMPQGASGLNINSWLQEFQDNPLPPPDPWIGEFINTADLSTLHDRSRIQMEDHYKDKLTGEGGIVPTLLAFFSNFGLTLPEWLMPLEDLLVWLGATLTDTAQPLFETLLSFFDFLNTSLGVPLMEGIASFLGWLFTTFSGAIETLLKPAFEFLKWLMEQFSGEVDSLLKPVFEFLQWLLTEFSGSVETLLQPAFDFLKWLFTLFDGTVDSLLKPAAEFLEWLFTLFGGAVDSTLKPAAEFIEWLFDGLGDGVETLLKPLVNFGEWLFGLFAGADVDNLLKPLFQFGKWLFTEFDGLVETVLKPAFEWLQWLILEFGSNTTTALEPIFEWLSWLWTEFGAAAESFLKPVFLWLEWLWGEFGSSVESFLKPVFQWLDWLWTEFGSSVETFLKPVFEWLDWLWTEFGSTAETFLKPVLNFFDWLWNGVQDGFGGFGGAVETFLKPLVEWLDWLWNEFGSTAETFLKPVAEFLSWLWTQFGAVEQTFLRPIITFFSWLWSGVEGGFAGFGGAVDTVLKPLFEWLNWLWSSFGAGADTFLRSLFEFFDWMWNGVAGGFAGFSNAVDTVLKPIFLFWDWLLGIFDTNALAEIFATFKSLTDTFGNLTSWIGSIPDATAVLGMIQAITGFAVDSIAEGLAKLVEWAQSIPLIGPIIGSLMGNFTNPETGTNSTFADLVAWSKNQLGLDSAIPSPNLIGFIPDELVSLIPVGHVGNTQPNLVTDQAFASEAAVQSGNGWSWDSATTKPDSGGGSAKVECSGGVNQLFSNLIAVSSGQQLNVSASVKWEKGSSFSSSPLISVGVRGYDGAEVKYTQTVASLTASNVSGGWTTISGNHTVPANVTVTNVRLVLAVTNGPTGTVVWFDEAVMKKTSLISQTLVNELPATLNNKTSTASFQELLNKIAKTTGASVAQVEAAINTYLTSGSALSGSRILSGNIDSAFISDLVDTWNKVRYGVNGQVVSGSTAVSAADDLRNFTTSTSNLSSLINANGVTLGSLSNASSILGRRTDSVEGATVQLQNAVKELQTAVKEIQSNVNTKINPAITELQSGVNSVLKPAVTELQSTSNNKTKPAITELQTAVNSVLKPAVTELQSNANTKTKPAIAELQLAVRNLQLAQSITPTNTTTVPSTTTTVPTTTTTTVTNTTTTVPTTPTTTTTNTTGNVVTNPTAPVGTTVTPIVSVTDDFERTASTMGSGWTTRVNNPNGSVLGTHDGHNAQFLNPSITTVSSAVVAVWYNSVGAYSSTPYQRVSTTLSSAASRPLVGTQGYNDLIARANPGNPLFGIVCRFFPDGAVRLFYRLGAWESNPYSPSNLIGSFTSSIKPTTGTILELFAGNKATSDPTRISVKVGTALVGTSYISPAVLGSLGLGWGFGMGNGVSFAAAQPAGGLNYWAGQDQV